MAGREAGVLKWLEFKADKGVEPALARLQAPSTRMRLTIPVRFRSLPRPLLPLFAALLLSMGLALLAPAVRAEGLATADSALEAGAPAPIVTQTVTPTVVNDPDRSGEFDWLVAGWAKVRDAKDAAQVTAALEAIKAGGIKRGLSSMELPALALLRAGDGEIKLPLEARINWARSLGQDSAAVQFAAANAAWSLGVGSAVSGYVEAFSTLSRDFGYLAGVTSRFAVVVSLSFVLVFVLFSGAMLLKNGPGLVHDLGHLLPVEPPFAFRLAMGVALAGLPILFGVGWLGMAAFWLLLVWGTLCRRERIVGLIFLAFLAAAHPIMNGVATLLPSPDSQRSLEAILRVRSGTATEADRRFLEEEAGRTGDPIVVFSLARAAWLAGDTDQAVVAMRRALEIKPGWIPATNNLAILLLEQGEVQEAEALLKNAIEREPKDVSLLFNLSYLYRKEFRLRKAETAYLAARDVDPETVERFTQVTDSQQSFVILSTLSYTDLWREHTSKEEGRSLLAETLGRPYLGRIPALYWPIAVLVGLFLAEAVARLLARRGRAGRCGRCGAEVCPACLGNEMHNGVCGPCHDIYVNGVPVEAQVRLSQDQRVMHYLAGRRRRILLTGWLMPGLGHLLIENVFRGAGFLFLACLTAYAPLSLVISGVSQGLWKPLVGWPLGGTVAFTAWICIFAAFVLGGRDLFNRVRPIQSH